MGFLLKTVITGISQNIKSRSKQNQTAKYYMDKNDGELVFVSIETQS